MAVISRKRVSPISVISNICGRCNGQGEIAFYNDALGMPDTQNCPICSGTGVSGYMDTVSQARSSLPVNRNYADGVISGRSGRKR